MFPNITYRNHSNHLTAFHPYAHAREGVGGDALFQPQKKLPGVGGLHYGHPGGKAPGGEGDECPHLSWRRNLNLSYPDYCMKSLRNTIQGYSLGPPEGQRNDGHIVHRWLLQRL